MRRWLAEVLLAEAEEAQRRCTGMRRRPVAWMPQPRVEQIESGWVATVPAPDWRYPPEWRV